jgi:hypothetical protein
MELDTCTAYFAKLAHFSTTLGTIFLLAYLKSYPAVHTAYKFCKSIYFNFCWSHLSITLGLAMCWEGGAYVVTPPILAPRGVSTNGRLTN